MNENEKPTEQTTPAPTEAMDIAKPVEAPKRKGLRRLGAAVAGMVLAPAAVFGIHAVASADKAPDAPITSVEGDAPAPVPAEQKVVSGETLSPAPTPEAQTPEATPTPEAPVKTQDDEIAEPGTPSDVAPGGPVKSDNENHAATHNDTVPVPEGSDPTDFVYPGSDGTPVDPATPEQPVAPQDGSEVSSN